MRLSDWNEVGLDSIDRDIAAAFEPFVGRRPSGSDHDWRHDLRQRQWRILRRYVARRLIDWIPGQGRNPSRVMAEYDEVWRDGHTRYRIGPLPYVSPWVWRGEPLLANAIGATRFRHEILARIIGHLKPQQVLEVGAGN